MAEYDLEERSYTFAKNCREYTKKLKKSIHNIEYAKQLVRASASQAANYIEANESLSKKDFKHRIKICRKESKESRLFLRLSDVYQDVALLDHKNALIQEATELLKIYSSILVKSK